MELIKNAWIIVLCMVVVPLCAGTIITHFMKKKRNKNLLVCYCAGMMLSWTVFQLLVIPMIFLDFKFPVLVYAYGGSMLVISFLGLLISRKDIKLMVANTKAAMERLPWFFILAVGIIAIQTFMIVYYQHLDEDDSFYVATAVVTNDSNTLFHFDPYTGAVYDALPSRYVLSPLPVFIAFLSRVAHIHPAVLAHTILPAFLIPLAYAVILILGNQLFRGNKRSLAVFLLLVAVLNMYGNSSRYTAETFMLYRTWQGKAILASILIPFLLYAARNAMEEKAQLGDWLLLFCVMTASSMVSSMGIFLALIELGMLTLIYTIQKKKVLLLKKAALCSVPCILGGLMYILIK